MRFFIVIFLTQLYWGFAQKKINFKELKTVPGFFKTYYDDSNGKLYLEVDKLNQSFIYVSALSQGIGNNDLLLDRGQLGSTKIVKFIKAGNKLLLLQPNQNYRAITNNALEKKSVDEAFGKSVLFGFEIIKSDSVSYILDFTPFLMQDTHGVAQVLKQKKQGSFNLDLSKSALNMARTKSFPENVDFDVLLTLKGNPESNGLRKVVPEEKLVTIYQHHSFVKLPDSNFKPRLAHPNSGSITTSFMNYSAPINTSMEVKYANRHRLEKKYPEATISEAVEPIIYYLDNGTPEPIRSALIEGASWWNEAFEDIGFTNAFQVKILPDTIDPLDVRYNVIQWIHRSSRGWSYGGGVVDPRTGEIIKGHVSLGSLRVRQDYKIAKALLNGSDDPTQIEFALARIRQLGAHEVGHTLGFAHNFAASINDRASVMDYPHPLVLIKDGKIDVSQAYDSGIGAWDKVTVAYTYSEFNENDNEDDALKNLINDAMSKYYFISDSDARPIGGSSAFGHLWDNGVNPVEELKRMILVRNTAISNFNDKCLENGESYAELEDLFVLLYYFHRYQSEAAVKWIGGRIYNFGLNGESLPEAQWVSSANQKEALNTLLETVSANFLAIPSDKLQWFPDRGAWQYRGRESFKSQSGPTFDPISAAQSATDFILQRLFHVDRINRVFNQSLLDSNQLDINEFINLITDKTLNQTHSDPYLNAIQHTVNKTVITHLMHLAQSNRLHFEIRSIVNKALLDIKKDIDKQRKPKVIDLEMSRFIASYFKAPEKMVSAYEVKLPDGSPIGSYSCGED